MTKTYQGFIKIKDYCYNEENVPNLLFLSSLEKPLVEELQWMVGCSVAVRYWVTEQKATKEQAEESLFRTIIGKADGCFQARYSEATGYLWTDAELKVGGHELFDELYAFGGKWLILEIDKAQ